MHALTWQVLQDLRNSLVLDSRMADVRPQAPPSPAAPVPPTPSPLLTMKTNTQLGGTAQRLFGCASVTHTECTVCKVCRLIISYLRSVYILCRVSY